MNETAKVVYAHEAIGIKIQFIFVSNFATIVKLFCRKIYNAAETTAIKGMKRIFDIQK